MPSLVVPGVSSVAVAKVTLPPILNGPAVAAASSSTPLERLLAVFSGTQMPSPSGSQSISRFVSVMKPVAQRAVLPAVMYLRPASAPMDVWGRRSGLPRAKASEGQ